MAEKLKQFRIHLKPHGPDAIYKATIAVKSQHAEDLKSVLHVPDTSFDFIDVEAASTALAYKKACQMFRPDDARKLNKRKYMDHMEVGVDLEAFRMQVIREPGRYVREDGTILVIT